MNDIFSRAFFCPITSFVKGIISLVLVEPGLQKLRQYVYRY